MKLFDYWTELPSALSTLFPELSENLIHFSLKLKETRDLITSNQSNINENLTLLEYSDLMIDCKKLLKEKVLSVQKEKNFVIIECVKLTVRMVKESINILSELNKEDSDFLMRSSLFLKITRLIKDKLAEEVNYLNEQMNLLDFNDNLYYDFDEEKKFLQTVEVFIEKNQIKLINICSTQKLVTSSQIIIECKDETEEVKDLFLQRKTSSKSGFSKKANRGRKKNTLESIQSNQSLSTKNSNDNSDEEVDIRKSYNYSEKSEFKLTKL